MGIDFPLAPETRSKVIDDLLLRLRENYVFPDVAKEMEESIRLRLSNGEYDGITTASTLCDMLTAHMQEVSHDKHLRLFFEEPQAQADEQQEHERWNEEQ